MKLGSGKIIEIRQNGDGRYQAVIQVNGVTTPSPGQYLQAHRPIDHHQTVGETIFPGGLPEPVLPPSHFLTASGIPAGWQPGDMLELRGPLGKGFSIAEETSRLALCAFGELSDHLLPLAGDVLSRGGEVSLVTNGDFSHLPARVEIGHMDDLPDLLRWADAAAIAIPMDGATKAFDHLQRISPLPCPTQVVIYGQFPCNALAACGICAVKAKKGRALLVCQDGPVFDWGEIS